METTEEEFNNSIMDEWREEQQEWYKEREKLISDYKDKLKDLINVEALFSWLYEQNNWSPLGIVDIELTEEKCSGYSTYQHARIVKDPDRLLYMKTSMDDDEIDGVEYYYVWQQTGYMEDDYSGFMLFELSDGKFFKVSYSS